MSAVTTGVVVMPLPRSRHRADVRPRTPLTDLQAAVAGHGRPLRLAAAGTGLIAITVPTVTASASDLKTDRAAVTDSLEVVSMAGEVVTERGTSLVTPNAAHGAFALTSPTPRPVEALDQAAGGSLVDVRAALAAAEEARVVAAEAERVAAEEREAAERAEQQRVAAEKAEKERQAVAAQREAERQRAASARSSTRESAPAAAPATQAPAAAPAASGGAAGIIATARKYLGVPYKYGGTNPAVGLDCSGLLQLVFKQHGISLPRTAAAQAAAGTPVSKANARAGDLVAFRDASGYVDHIGLYLGNGRMLAAPKPGDVVKEQNVYERRTFYVRL